MWYLCCCCRVHTTHLYEYWRGGVFFSTKGFMTFVNNGIKLSCSVFTFSNLTQKTIGKWSQTRATEFEGSSLRFQKSPFPNQTFIYIWHSACGRYISARISNYCLGECLLYLKVVIAVNSRWKAWLLPPYSKCIVRLVFGHLEKNSSPKNLKITMRQTQVKLPKISKTL